MHPRKHAMASNADFRNAERRDLDTGWQTPSLHESCRSDGTWEHQQVRVRSNWYRAR